jgi:hypothetical protein
MTNLVAVETMNEGGNNNHTDVESQSRLNKNTLAPPPPSNGLSSVPGRSITNGQSMHNGNAPHDLPLGSAPSTAPSSPHL